MYAGQISNYDTNDLNWFPINVPDIPLSPNDTTYQPSKLLAVWRTKRLYGEPYWLKDIIENRLKLTGPVSDAVHISIF